VLVSQLLLLLTMLCGYIRSSDEGTADATSDVSLIGPTMSSSKGPRWMVGHTSMFVCRELGRPCVRVVRGVARHVTG
jgi:hypothetical protein